MRNRFAQSIESALDERERQIRERKERYELRRRQVAAFIAEAEQRLTVAVEVLNERLPAGGCTEQVSLIIEIDERPFDDITAEVRVETPTPAASPGTPHWQSPQPTVSWYCYLRVSAQATAQAEVKIRGTRDGWHFAWEGLSHRTPECDPGGLRIERAESGALVGERFVAWFTKYIL